eukprot:TRINITY_DN6451_c0_g1_i1.p1 TRINITY_DN6451_c0_g1~~TRINITY_DN6451_c0_g1_i1.p1  ORF type:complete len:281 (+),score=48.54 TRINITY_DN6451_c0_g1_i1:124-843(+)
MAVTLCGRPTLLCCSCSFVYCLSSRIPSKRTLCIVVSEKKSYHAVPPPKSISSERFLEEHPQYGRRKILLRSSEIAALAAILNLFRGTKPKFLGVQKNPPSLALCPATPNCISTAEELNDPSHYVPPWNYNAEDKRARNEPATKEQAMSELLDVILSTKPDNYTPHIVEKTTDYVRVEYESPFLGFVDDVEFWFPPGKSSIVEYRSASRFGNYDFDINRKRIKALRLALKKKGWESVGY